MVIGQKGKTRKWGAWSFLSPQPLSISSWLLRARKTYLTDPRNAFLFANKRNKTKGLGRIILSAESKHQEEKDILQSLGFSFSRLRTPKHVTCTCVHLGTCIESPSLVHRYHDSWLHTAPRLWATNVYTRDRPTQCWWEQDNCLNKSGFF